MREMMEGTVLPELRERAGGAIVSRVLRVAGMGESAVAERLADLFAASANPSVAYLASMGEVKVRLTAKAATADEASSLLAPLAEEVAIRLGDVVFTTDDESLEQVAVRLLDERSMSLACAESLTGGGVGERLTSVAGASTWFRGSAVVYTREMKQRVLGVPDEALVDGTVTEACALAMARGARELFGADLGLALTGAAGPEPHDGAAPGTIWVAIVGDDVEHARGFLARGERDRVRRWAQQGGLDLVRRYLQRVPLPATSLPGG
jgi:nicotinamide-nucleotide amidase